MLGEGSLGACWRVDVIRLILTSPQLLLHERLTFLSSWERAGGEGDFSTLPEMTDKAVDG